MLTNCILYKFIISLVKSLNLSRAHEKVDELGDEVLGVLVRLTVSEDGSSPLDSNAATLHTYDWKKIKTKKEEKVLAIEEEEEIERHENL